MQKSEYPIHIDEETPDMYFLRAIECAIVALSKCPTATDRLLNVLCEAYEAVNKHNKD